MDSARAVAELADNELDAELGLSNSLATLDYSFERSFAHLSFDEPLLHASSASDSDASVVNDNNAGASEKHSGDRSIGKSSKGFALANANSLRQSDESDDLQRAIRVSLETAQAAQLAQYRENTEKV